MPRTSATESAAAILLLASTWGDDCRSERLTDEDMKNCPVMWVGMEEIGMKTFGLTDDGDNDGMLGIGAGLLLGIAIGDGLGQTDGCSDRLAWDGENEGPFVLAEGGAVVEFAVVGDMVVMLLL